MALEIKGNKKERERINGAEISCAGK